MHIVFILSGYYPYYSAVGRCLGNIADIFDEEAKVTVICNMTRLSQERKEQYGRQTIIRISTKIMKRRINIEDSIPNAVGIKKKGLAIKLLIARANNTIRMLMSQESTQEDLMLAYLEALFGLDQPVDILIPTCSPFETVMAAMSYKKKYPTVKLVPYLFDKFADSDTLHRFNFNKRIKMKRNLALEREMMILSDKVLYVPTWTPHIQKNSPDLSQKGIEVEHPLIVKTFISNPMDYTRDNIHIVYTGVLDLKNRNPEYTLKVFTRLHNMEAIKVHFYSLGSAQQMINRYAKRHPSLFISHGQVPSNEARSAMFGSTILLSIGNKDISQIPSKLFEYMSCGKPIIHFSYSKDDPAINVLKNYPLSQIVFMDIDKNSACLLIEAFINKSSKKLISFDQVSACFVSATPKFIKKQIVEASNNYNSFY